MISAQPNDCSIGSTQRAGFCQDSLSLALYAKILRQICDFFAVGNYLIFYRPIAEGIEVIRVLHGARATSAGNSNNCATFRNV